MVLSIWSHLRRNKPNKCFSTIFTSGGLFERLKIRWAKLKIPSKIKQPLILYCTVRCFARVGNKQVPLGSVNDPFFPGKPDR